jgi:excisionase family DNA binding protein
VDLNLSALVPQDTRSCGARSQRGIVAMQMKNQSEETPDPSRSLAEIIQGRRKALKIDELADLLGVAPTTLYDMARDGWLPCMRIGSAIRLDPKAIADWLRARS